MFFNYALVALSLLSSTLLVEANNHFGRSKITNAERLRHRQPPLPPRSLFNPTRVSTALRAKRSPPPPPPYFTQFQCNASGTLEPGMNQAFCCSSEGYVEGGVSHAQGFSTCVPGSGDLATCNSAQSIPVCCQTGASGAALAAGHYTQCISAYQAQWFCPTGGLNGDGRDHAGCCNAYKGNKGFTGCSKITQKSDNKIACNVGQQRVCCAFPIGTGHENCDGFGQVYADGS